MNQSTTFYDLLENFKEYTKNSTDRGKLFEKFTAKFLTTSQTFKQQFIWVRPYADFSQDGKDLGVDLVAKKIDGTYTAIQCKFYKDDALISKGDIDSFIAQSSRGITDGGKRVKFSDRLLVDTAKGIGANALTYFEDPELAIHRLDAHEIAQSGIDWDSFKIQDPSGMKPARKKILREHQKEAISAIQKAFENADRAKLIMACGTGKSLTAIRLADFYANGAEAKIADAGKFVTRGGGAKSFIY